MLSVILVLVPVLSRNAELPTGSGRYRLGWGIPGFIRVYSSLWALGGEGRPSEVRDSVFQ